MKKFSPWRKIPQQADLMDSILFLMNDLSLRNKCVSACVVFLLKKCRHIREGTVRHHFVYALEAPDNSSLFCS